MEPTRDRRERPSGKAAARLVFGLFIIALGVLFTLDQMGLVDAEDYLPWWPVVFILLGLVKLAQSGRGLGAGLVWIGVGLLFLASTLGYLPFSLFDLWPLILVLLGWRLVARARREATRGGEGAEPELSAVAVMGGLKRSNRSRSFRGGDLTAIMGGCEIDLRQAALAGEEAVLDVFAFWGGIEIRVPESWAVEDKVLPLLGAFENRTAPPGENAAGRLVIRGFVVMGGVEVTH